MNTRMKTLFKRILFIYLPVAVMIIWTLFPFYWTIVTSLKTSSQIITKPITYFPHPVTFNNYIKAWNVGGFSRYFMNSMLVSLVSMIFTIVCATMSGYALARYAFKGKQAFIVLLLCTQFIPSAMLIIPLFMIFNTIGMINTPWALIFTYTVFHIPFNATLMSTFIKGIPYSLEEAAKVDGCTGFQAFNFVLFPVSSSFSLCIHQQLE